MNDTTYEVGVEDIELYHWVAYVFGLPGCFSSGLTQIEAAAGIQASIDAYVAWLRRLDPTIASPEPLAGRVVISEVCPAYPADEDPYYLVNAFFNDDTRVLTSADISEALRLLEWTRQDFFALVQNLSVERLHQLIPDDERFKTIAGILKHVAAAEWWYCDRLGLVADWTALPDDPLKALEVSRANTRLRLPELEGSTLITEKVGERWSARKLVRRTLWHERDHTDHIRKLLQPSL